MRRLSLVLAATLFSISSHAVAQNADWDTAETEGALDRQAAVADVDLAPVVRDPYRGHLTLETAFFRRKTHGVTTTLVSPLLDLGHRVGESVALGARFGLAGAVVDAPSGLGGLAFDGSRLRVGNPELRGGYYHAFVAWPRVIELYVGTGVTIPVASLPGSAFGLGGGSGRVLSSVALGGATSMRGIRDSWLWLPDTLGILLPSARVDMTQGALDLGASFDLALLVPTANTSTRDNEMRGQFMLSAAYHVVPAFRLGTAFSAVAQLSGGRLGGDGAGGDDFQSSLDLFAGVESGGGVAELRFTTNLDHPVGFSFDDTGLWGLRLLVGVRLP